MRKTIIIASTILVFILFIIFFVSRFKNQSPATSNQSLVTPTAVILEEDQESRIS